MWVMTMALVTKMRNNAGTIILYADGNEEDCDNGNHDHTFSSIPDPLFSSI